MKKALILTWEKFQDHETVYPFYALHEHEYNVTIAANKRNEKIFGSLGVHMLSNIHVEDLLTPNYTITDFDLLLIPGGVKCLEKLRLEEKAVQFVREWFKANKPTMCICNGGQLLITADVLRGRKCAGYYSIEPDIKNAGAEYSRTVTVDGNLISCAHYDDMGEWMRTGMKIFDVKND